MTNDDKQKISDALLLIDGLFFKDIDADTNNFFYKNNEILRELLKIKDPRFIKVLDKHLINYIYNNDFLKFNVNIKDPLYFVKFIRLYIDYDKYKNYTYKNMAKYLYFMYIKELKLSKNPKLNILIHEYHDIVKEVYKSHKLTLEEIQSFCRLLVYLITYLYMNNELLDNNDKLFYDIYNTMIEDNFYADMKLNGVFSLKEEKEEDDLKIYYIEKAIKMNIKKKELK